MKFNFKIQQYQTDAVDAVVKVFAGQGFHDRIRYIRDLGKRTVPDVLSVFCMRIQFHKGQQIDYVLGKFSPQDMAIVEPKIDMACEMIASFACAGIANTMNLFNNK